MFAIILLQIGYESGVNIKMLYRNSKQIVKVSHLQNNLYKIT